MIVINFDTLPYMYTHVATSVLQLIRNKSNSVQVWKQESRAVARKPCHRCFRLHPV